MNPERDVALVDELRSQPSESPWLEFKRNNKDPEMIGKRCSALSNAARIEGKNCAFMLWGIADGTHEVVGTDYDPEAEKVGGQVLQFWLAQNLQPSIAFSFRTVAHPQGRVVLLEIPAGLGRRCASMGRPISGSGVPRPNSPTIRSAIRS